MQPKRILKHNQENLNKQQELIDQKQLLDKKKKNLNLKEECSSSSSSCSIPEPVAPQLKIKRYNKGKSSISINNGINLRSCPTKLTDDDTSMIIDQNSSTFSTNKKICVADLRFNVKQTF